MRPSPLLLSFLLLLALPLPACATDDGFRARLAQGCRSEPECVKLAAQADARAGTCPSAANSNVVIRLHLDLGSSAPPCDEVEEDRRIAHSYLDGLTQERARQAALAAPQVDAATHQKAIRRQEKHARRVAEQERQRAAAEADEQRRRQEEEAAQDRAERAAREDAARAQVERAAREKATQDTAASAPRSTPVVPETPAPRDTGGHVCCCDGTVSPTCTTVHRGCCSHHGGVCSCD